jgi:hypothetical protein
MTEGTTQRHIQGIPKDAPDERCPKCDALWSWQFSQTPPPLNKVVYVATNNGTGKEWLRETCWRCGYSFHRPCYGDAKNDPISALVSALKGLMEYIERVENGERDLVWMQERWSAAVCAVRLIEPATDEDDSDEV